MGQYTCVHKLHANGLSNFEYTQSNMHLCPTTAHSLNIVAFSWIRSFLNAVDSYPHGYVRCKLATITSVLLQSKMNAAMHNDTARTTVEFEYSTSEEVYFWLRAECKLLVS